MGNYKFNMSLPSGKPIIFRGVATAIITPFSGRDVDFGAMREMTERQIEAGISAIVVCGTTGEAPTLKHDEHIECIRQMVEIVGGRIPVIAGTGSNDTDHAVTQ
ncbi:MAG TPA: dihydrodipicolinate synthase family protein, partial [Bacillota bacterium]|nr:dihydrodipicolinate synthase family protein [Bacillota bacterium]